WNDAGRRQAELTQSSLCRALALARGPEFPDARSACDLTRARSESLARPIDAIYDLESAMLPGKPAVQAALSDLAWFPLGSRELLPRPDAQGGDREPGAEKAVGQPATGPDGSSTRDRTSGEAQPRLRLEIPASK